MEDRLHSISLATLHLWASDLYRMAEQAAQPLSSEEHLSPQRTNDISPSVPAHCTIGVHNSQKDIKKLIPLLLIFR